MDILALAIRVGRKAADQGLITKVTATYDLGRLLFMDSNNSNINAIILQSVINGQPTFGF